MIAANGGLQTTVGQVIKFYAKFLGAESPCVQIIRDAASADGEWRSRGLLTGLHAGAGFGAFSLLFGLMPAATRALFAVSVI